MTEERGQFDTHFGDEPVVLLPERALYYPAEEALVVADLHWGKAASLRAQFVPVPTGTTANDLERLSRALAATSAKRLVILGDLLHARNGRSDGTFRTIADWRARHAQLDIVLVRGNHDVHAGDPPSALDIRCEDAPYHLGAFTCVHDPEADFADGALIMAGHLHPTIPLTGRGKQRVRLPCFVCANSLLVLPAFSSFTGGGMYEYVEGDELYVIADDVVMPVAPRAD